MSAEVTTLIREIIQATIPSLQEEKLKLVVEKLIQLGVESREDLKYVREEDMVEFIRPIQCRKLVNCWKSQDLDETVVKKCKEWLKGVESATAFGKVDKLAGLPTQ